MTMAARDLRELGARYENVRARILDLVAGVDAQSIPVPACPGWSVHDLLAHLTGNCADVMRGNVAGVASPEWTAAQVAERRAKPTEAVLEEWNELAPPYAAMLDDFPGGFDGMAVSDITSHEQDLRGALAEPGARDSDEVELAIEFLVTLILHPAAVSSGIGPLEIEAGDRSWVVGGDGATGRHDRWIDAVLAEARPDGRPTPVASVAAHPFELFRAASGRRSERQIRTFDWSTDPEPYIGLFGSGPFSITTEDLVE